MPKSKNIFYVLGILCAFLVASQAAFSQQVVGWVEKVSIHPGNLVLKAKIDSGAKTTSLHCECISIAERDGKKWVSFTVTNDKGEQIRLEREVQRIAKIKRHFGESQERAVITMGVCLANVYKEVEVNIVDRSGLNYAMLIGRNFLAGDFLIDSSNTYTQKPRCQVGQE